MRSLLAMLIIASTAHADMIWTSFENTTGFHWQTNARLDLTKPGDEQILNGKGTEPGIEKSLNFVPSRDASGGGVMIEIAEWTVRDQPWNFQSVSGNEGPLTPAAPLHDTLEPPRVGRHMRTRLDLSIGDSSNLLHIGERGFLYTVDRKLGILGYIELELVQTPNAGEGQHWDYQPLSWGWSVPSPSTATLAMVALAFVGSLRHRCDRSYTGVQGS